MSRSSSGASCNELVTFQVPLSPLSPDLMSKSCQLLIDILFSNPFPLQVKTVFRELGGMLVLIELIKASKTQELAILALTALHASFSGVEENKVFLANELGYRELLAIVNSVLPLPDLYVFFFFFFFFFFIFLGTFLFVSFSLINLIIIIIIIIIKGFEYDHDGACYYWQPSHFFWRGGG
jgi:hypothetical protein